nr:hypothetical protein CFP56_21794 [Quercus suber]
MTMKVYWFRQPRHISSLSHDVVMYLTTPRPVIGTPESRTTTLKGRCIQFSTVGEPQNVPCKKENSPASSTALSPNRDLQIRRCWQTVWSSLHAERSAAEVSGYHEAPFRMALSSEADAFSVTGPPVQPPYHHHFSSHSLHSILLGGLGYPLG